MSLAEGSPSGTTAFTFTVSLSNPVASNVTVDYATANGTATTADNDYTGASGTVTFTAGGALTQSVTVNVSKDSKVEADETFLVNLSNARFGGATDATRAAITDSQGVGTILNDEQVPQLSIGTPAAITEGDTGSKNLTFTVTLSASSSETVTVNYATSNGTATAGSDYTSTSETLTFDPGVTSQPINVPILGDYAIEGNGTFTVTLSGAVNANINTGAATGTIQDDDVAGADGHGDLGSSDERSGRDGDVHGET